MKEYEIIDSFNFKFKIPEFYKLIEKKIDGFSFHFNGLFIIISIEIKNAKKWIHVSYSRKNRIPDYLDTIRIKKHFIGENRKAIMIFPEKENYVNIHKCCLHLFCCLDSWDIPEFSFMGSL